MKLRDEARPSRFSFGGRSCIRPPVIRPPSIRPPLYVIRPPDHRLACTSSRPPCEPLTLWPPIHQHACTTAISPGDGSGHGDQGWQVGEPSQPVALLTPRPPLTMAHCIQPLAIPCRWSPVHRCQPVHLFTCTPLVRFATFGDSENFGNHPQGVRNLRQPGQSIALAIIA